MKYITILMEENLIVEGYINAFRDEFSECFIGTKNYRDINLNDNKTPSMDMVIIQQKILLMNLHLLDYFKNKGVKVATWTTRADKEQLLTILKLNIDGYFAIEMELNELRTAIETICKGNKYIHSHFTTTLLDEFERLSNSDVQRPIGLLTKREWEVLEKMTCGLSNMAIAKELIISDRTVKNHISSILRKLKTKDRTSAVLIAIQNKWVNIY